MKTDWIDEFTALLAELAEFRKNTGVLVAEWDKKKGNKNEENALMIELSALLAEADALSRLIDSILDGTEEIVPVDDLRERFVGLKRKMDLLIGRWKARAKGWER